MTLKIISAVLVAQTITVNAQALTDTIQSHELNEVVVSADFSIYDAQ